MRSLHFILLKNRLLKNKKGFVLVLVLLIVALLMAMVVDFAYGIYVDMNGLNNLRVLERLGLECSSLIQSSSGLLSQGISSGVITPGAPEMEVPIEGDVKVYFRLDDESSKFNLNRLVPDGIYDKENETQVKYYRAFQRLLNTLGLDAGIADRVIDWIDRDSIPMDRGNEKGAKNALLDSVSELKLFIDPASYAKLEPYVTVWPKDNLIGTGINVNTASVPVLMCLSKEISQSVAESMVTFRERQPLSSGNLSNFSTDLLNMEEYIVYKSQAYSLHARAEEGGIKKVIDAVTDTSGKIQYWREY